LCDTIYSLKHSDIQSITARKWIIEYFGWRIVWKQRKMQTWRPNKPCSPCFHGMHRLSVKQNKPNSTGSKNNLGAGAVDTWRRRTSILNAARFGTCKLDSLMP
jgi:hypothetical protein